MVWQLIPAWAAATRARFGSRPTTRRTSISRAPLFRFFARGFETEFRCSFQAGLPQWVAQLQWTAPSHPTTLTLIPSTNLIYYNATCDCAALGGCQRGGGGQCFNGRCACQESHLFGGDDCSEIKCRSIACAQSEVCYLNANKTLPYPECGGQGASSFSSLFRISTLHHAGHCDNGVCVCDRGASPVDQCVSKGCPGNGKCSHHGYCDGVCVCDPGELLRLAAMN